MAGTEAQERNSGAMKSVQCGNTWSNRDQCSCGSSDSMSEKSPGSGKNVGTCELVAQLLAEW